MKRVFKFILVFAIIAIIGTLSHFVYDWLNENKAIAFLVPTNESIFEHLKMFFFPVMIVSLIQVIKKENKGLFLASRVYGSLFAIITCIAFYYTYKTNVVEINDAVFVVSYYVILFIGLLISYNMYHYTKDLPSYIKWIAYALAIATIVVFIYYSYSPLNNEFFLELGKK